MHEPYKDVLIDVNWKDRKFVADLEAATVEDIVDVLLRYDVHSRGEAEIYVTDGIIKINITKR